MLDSGVAGSDDPNALTWEIAQNPPDTEVLVAAFAADCRYTPTVSFEDMDGTQSAKECEARAFDQNCAPDTFGCWSAAERCRDGCSAPCTSCTARCGDTCEGCKRDCDGGACARSCAVSRNACRVACLHRLHTCRTQDCQAALDTCDADAAARTRRQCPDCDALRACQQKAFDAKGDAAACAPKFPNNAAECLEWCSPEQ